VQAPDLSKNQLALSGLYLNGTQPKPANGVGGTDGQQAVEGDAASGPAVRQLRQGMLLNYTYTIYNAQADASGKPQLQTQMRLLNNGKEVFTGKVVGVNVNRQTDLKRLNAGGGLLVGSNLAPGDYVLLVTVIDTLARNKRQGVAIQWIEFQITR
jgi:hypothetical protein